MIVALLLAIWISVVFGAVFLAVYIDKHVINILQTMGTYAAEAHSKIRARALADAAEKYDSMEEQAHLKVVAQTFDPRGERSLPAQWMLEQSVMEAGRDD